jgi:hypothetical protein
VGARRATTKIRVCPRQFPDKPHYQFCQKQFLLVQESESCPSSGFDPMHSRFYFHLTNGEDVIGDEVGAPAADVHAAVSYALEAIEQLRAEDPSVVAEWLGWTLEVTDEMGRIIETFSLDDPLSKTSPRH